MTSLRLLLALGLACAFSSCTPSIDMPKGSSKSYSSARLVFRAPNARPVTVAKERKVHSMIQKSLATQFSANGMPYGSASADLVVAYLVVYQETGMTTYFDDYFGSGRSPDEISDVAHERGVIKGERPDYYQAAGLVIDVIDARTNKLVFRNVFKADVVQGGSDSARAQRINAGVAQALAPFFK